MMTTKARRITIDLSPSAATEVDRLAKVTGKNTAALFRSAFSLLRIAINAAASGMEIHLVDPTGVKEPVKLEIE